MDGGDTNLGGLKIHHDDSRPTSPSGSAGPVFESFEANTPTVPSTPPAQTENPTPPIPTNAPTDTQPNIAQVNEPVNIPPNTTPAPPVPFTPQNIPNTPAAPVNSTFSAEPNVSTGVNNFNNLAPQSPVFSPVISQPMDTEIIDNRFDMTEGYNMEPKNPKRGKKILIILVLLLLIGGIGVGVWLGVKGGEKNQEDAMSSGAFKQFMCYLVDECAKEFSLEDYNAKGVYAIDSLSEVQDAPGAISYFNELRKRWEMSQVLFNSKNNQNYTSRINDDFDVIDMYINKNISTEDLFNRYLSGGENGLRDYYTEHYSRENTVFSDPVLNYLAIQDDYLNALINTLNAYEKYGCIYEGEIDNSCVEHFKVGNNNPEEYIAIARKSLGRYVGSIINDLKYNLKQLIDANKENE